jgi:hypothetical protein
VAECEKQATSGEVYLSSMAMQLLEKGRVQATKKGRLIK